jgi:predicted TIM-barrel fold metal-dependent hydrolase
MLTIDFHTHAFPQAIRKHRQRYFPHEPAFKLLYENPKARLIGADELVRAMDRQQVDSSVVFGFPWQDMTTCRMNNDYIIEAVVRYPDRLKGFCCVDPFVADAVGEVRRCLDAGLCGVGELAFYQGGIGADCIDRLTPIMKLLHQKDLPVLIHTNEPVGHLYPGKTPNTLAQIYRLIRRFPENKIVLAHWGGGLFFYSLLKKEVEQALANVYLDTAASPFLYRPAIYRYACELLGSRKILLGSDYPLIEPQRYRAELAQVGLAPGDLKRICGQNAAALLGLG